MLVWLLEEGRALFFDMLAGVRRGQCESRQSESGLVGHDTLGDSVSATERPTTTYAVCLEVVWIATHGFSSVRPGS
jgi:hypothetical protein